MLPLSAFHKQAGFAAGYPQVDEVNIPHSNLHSWFQQQTRTLRCLPVLMSRFADINTSGGPVKVVHRGSGPNRWDLPHVYVHRQHLRLKEDMEIGLDGVQVWTPSPTSLVKL